MKKIMIVFGTRPEAIKMAPVVKGFRSDENFETIVCVTGQHRQMLDQVLELFEIIPDYDLNIMKPGQDLFDVTGAVLKGMKDVLSESRPDMVLVHGDTSTSTAAALAAFYKQIPVGHVEAGLRTYDLNNPWPEEMNRQVTARLTTLHFSPTEKSRNNLISEHIPSENISVTGNTVIDALFAVTEMINNKGDIWETVSDKILSMGYDLHRLDHKQRRMVLITGHRRENFGEGFINICSAIKQLALSFPQVDFVYPMHLNPNVRTPIKEVFSEGTPTNVFFIEPLDYLPFVTMMDRSCLVLTDSGGIQEEAPSLGKPVLVMRNTTERPEAVEVGTVRLVGTDKERIISETGLLLTDKDQYEAMSTVHNPYGDGNAVKRIIDRTREYFEI